MDRVGREEGGAWSLGRGSRRRILGGAWSLGRGSRRRILGPSAPGPFAPPLLLFCPLLLHRPSSAAPPPLQRCPSDLWRATLGAWSWSAGISLLVAWSTTALLVHDASPLLWPGNFQCPLLCSILKAAQSNITCSVLKAVLCAVLALANQ